MSIFFFAIFPENNRVITPILFSNHQTLLRSSRWITCTSFTFPMQPRFANTWFWAALQAAAHPTHCPARHPTPGLHLPLHIHPPRKRHPRASAGTESLQSPEVHDQPGRRGGVKVPSTVQLPCSSSITATRTWQCWQPASNPHSQQVQLLHACSRTKEEMWPLTVAVAAKLPAVCWWKAQTGAFVEAGAGGAKKSGKNTSEQSKNMKHKSQWLPQPLAGTDSSAFQPIRCGSVGLCQHTPALAPLCLPILIANKAEEMSSSLPLTLALDTACPRTQCPHTTLTLLDEATCLWALGLRNPHGAAFPLPFTVGSVSIKSCTYTTSASTPSRGNVGFLGFHLFIDFYKAYRNADSLKPHHPGPVELKLASRFKIYSYTLSGCKESATTQAESQPDYFGWCLKTGLTDNTTNIPFDLTSLSQSQAGSNLPLQDTASTHQHS